MTIQLGQSSFLPSEMLQPCQNITKKISNWIFRFEDKIGQGNFSKVYRGFHQLTNEQVAIKIVELSSVKSAKLQELLFSQIEVIQSLNHPNILKCYQVLKSQNNCYIITELCDGGDLQSLLQEQKCLNQSSAATYIRDIFKGLLYLGQRGIVHRDLKIANIFIQNGVCKIADFGFAKYTNNQNFRDLDIGSPLYMSPQGMIDHLYGMKTDIWSFGVIIYELLHGKTPFSNCLSEKDLKRTVAVPISYQSLRADLSPQVKQLILGCLNVNLANRPDALSLVNDAFLKSILPTCNQTSVYVTSSSQNQTPLNHCQQLDNFQPFVQEDISAINDRFQRVQISSSKRSLPNLYMPVFVQQPLIYNQHQNLDQHKPLYQHQHQSLNQNQFIRQHQPLKQHQYLEQHQPLNQHQSLNQISYLEQHQPLIQLRYFDQHQPQKQHQHFDQCHYVQQQQPLNQTLVQDQRNTRPLQFSHSSPNRVASRANSKQSSISGSDLKRKNEQANINARLSRNIYINSPSLYHSNDLIQTSNNSHNDLISQSRYPRNQTDLILIPEQVQYKLFSKSMGQWNGDKGSNCSWSPHDAKKKFDKTLSYQNVNKVQNDCIPTSNFPRKTAQEGATNLNDYYNPSSNQRGLQHSRNSNDSRGSLVVQFFPTMKVVRPSCFKDELNGSNKKFGEIIKGEKRNDGIIKSTIKMGKVLNLPQNQIERTKTKSYIKYGPNVMNFSSPVQKKRPVRHSISEIHINVPNQVPSTNQSCSQSNQSVTHSSSNLINYSQYPSTTQNVTNLDSDWLIQPPHNVICTVIQFKQAVGFLHYCRLYFRFITTWRKLIHFPQVYKYQQFSQLFNRKQQQNQQIYSRFLLTAINQLNMNIRSKQIIYEGLSYKNKKVKEDKLKEVTEEYLKKYQEQINRDRDRGQNKKILPVYDKSTTIQWMKEHNQQIWEVLDLVWNKVTQVSVNNYKLSQTFIRHYRNLRYFSIRIIEANQIVASCIRTKNYYALADALMQNWLSQQFYGQQTYSSLKDQYLRKTYSNPFSQTNDTDMSRNQNL